MHDEGFVTNYTEIVPAKRTGPILESESFFGHDIIMKKYKDSFVKMQNMLNAMDLVSVQIFGEFAGGGIQKGVDYGEKDFYVFDILSDSGNEKVYWDDYVVESFATGVAIKCKNSKFSEKAKSDKPIKAKVELTENDKRVLEIFSEYVTWNRVSNVLSHIGTVTAKDFGRVMGLTMKDIGFCGHFPDTGVVVWSELSNEAKIKSIIKAREVTSYWDECSKIVQTLFARNSMQVLGLECTEPVDKVLYWAPEKRCGSVSGGTRVAVDIARRHGIECVNLYDKKVFKSLEEEYSPKFDIFSL